MPRRARQHQVGDFHHVMSHSIDSLNLFETPGDYQMFLSILGRNLTKYGCRCYGFALMPNHYHLILRPSGDEFSKMMSSINNAFARYINRTRKRRGYVFFDRFKSIPTRSLRYLQQLVLYINANPLNGNVVQDSEGLAEYEWCSHRDYLNLQQQRFSWLNCGYISEIINSPEGTGSYRTVFNKYCAVEFDPWQVDEQCEEVNDNVPLSLTKEEALWIRQMIQTAEQKRKQCERLQKTPNIIRILLHKSCDSFGVDPSIAFMKSRSNRVRNVLQLFSFWAVRCAGFSGSFIGRMVDRSATTILRAAQRGEMFNLPVPV
jgi:REP element-mobilizing transposase RayT